jgi:hypothetical protein
MRGTCGSGHEQQCLWLCAAVYAGHRCARELDGPDRGDDPQFKRELTALAPL